MNWTKLTKEEQLTILTNVAEDKGIVDNAVEKDYWVSMVKGLNYGKTPKNL